MQKIIAVILFGLFKIESSKIDANLKACIIVMITVLDDAQLDMPVPVSMADDLSINTIKHRISFALAYLGWL
jgi:hypothetical protein